MFLYPQFDKDMAKLGAGELQAVYNYRPCFVSQDVVANK
jgi:hypothetical protein